MKLRAAAVLLTAALTVTACGGDGRPAREGGQPLEVLAAFYPYQFVAERVGGADARVASLTQPSRS